MKKKYVSDSQNEIMRELKQLYRELVDFDCKKSNQKKTSQSTRIVVPIQTVHDSLAGIPQKNYPREVKQVDGTGPYVLVYMGPFLNLSF